jgi:uncharacterized protein DUF6572
MRLQLNAGRWAASPMSPQAHAHRGRKLMPVDNPQVVDAVGTDIRSDEVVLSLIDSSEWGSRGHLLALQAKLNSYFAFIETGQLLEDYPSARGKAVRIDVVRSRLSCQGGRHSQRHKLRLHVEGGIA